MLFDYKLRYYNFRLVVYVLALNVLGVLLIGSATNQDAASISKQIMGISVGFVVVMLLSLIDYHRLCSFATIIYGLCIALLLGVLIFGRTVNNATRWLILPGLGQIQPSEFVKIGLIVFFSWYFSKYQERINQVKVLFGGLLLLMIPFALIFEQPDLSTGLVVVVIFLSIIFAAGISWRWVAGAIAVCIPVFGLLIYLLQYNMIPFIKEYQARRILAWVNRAKYAEANLQQDNSIMAIGSGMLHGKGLNNNSLASVKNGNFLSEDQTDFIFAIIGEELGFIGCIAVIVLIGLVIFECLYMAARSRDAAGKLICTGFGTLIAFQSFTNIAVATGVFPNTGLPLPFISYGVSSLMSMYLGLGVALNVGLQRKTSN